MSNVRPITSVAGRHTEMTNDDFVLSAGALVRPSVPTGVTAVIPDGQQLIVVGQFSILGTGQLEVLGSGLLAVL